MSNVIPLRRLQLVPREVRAERDTVRLRLPGPGHSPSAARLRASIEETLAELDTHVPEGQSAVVRMPEDRRAAHLACHVALVADGEQWIGYTETVSTTTVVVRSYLARPAGAELSIVIELPSAQAVHARAVVETSEPPTHDLARMTLRVLETSADDFAALEDAIDLRAADPWRLYA